MTELKEALSQKEYETIINKLEKAYNSLLLSKEDGVGVASSLIEHDIVEDILEKKIKKLEKENKGWSLYLLSKDLLKLVSEMESIISSIRELEEKVQNLIERFRRAYL